MSAAGNEFAVEREVVARHTAALIDYDSKHAVLILKPIAFLKLRARL